MELDNPMSAPVKLTEKELQLFKDVDDIIGKSVTIGDPLIALDYGASLGRNATVSGLALAKLMFKLQQSWALFTAAGFEDDLPTMISVHMGISGQTFKKYINVWESIFENEKIDEETKMVLQGRSIGDLILLAPAVREGDLEGEELRNAALTLNHQELREKVYEKRGEQTSSATAIKGCLQMQDTPNMAAGTLYAKKGNKRDILFIINPNHGELAEALLDRIVRAAGIIEVYGV